MMHCNIVEPKEMSRMILIPAVFVVGTLAITLMSTLDSNA